MKKFSEQLHTKSQSVKLQTAERRALRERVVSYIEYHPMPGSQTVAPAGSTKSGSFFTVPFSYFARAGVGVAAFLLILVPALAERAVPGDGLYAVKVRFNEEVRSTLALSPYEKIEWETERLNRRIAEARLLASEGRLTDEVEAEVAAAVKTHTENAKREIEVLRGEDEEEATLATIALNTTLEVQATSLKEKTNQNNAEAKQPALLAAVVGEAAAKESASQAGVPGYERLMARVELNTTRIYELLETLGLSENSEDYQDVRRRLDDINRTVEQITIERETNEEAARLALVGVLQRTQKLIVYLTEIQTSQTFGVEDFVPVELTPEEQQSKLDAYRRDTQIIIADIEKTRASSTDQATVANTAGALERLYDLQAELSAATSSDAVEATFAEIQTIGTGAKEILSTQRNIDAENSSSES